MECKNKTQVIYKTPFIFFASLFKDNPINLECQLSEAHSKGKLLENLLVLFPLLCYANMSLYI